LPRYEGGSRLGSRHLHAGCRRVCFYRGGRGGGAGGGQGGGRGRRGRETSAAHQLSSGTSTSGGSLSLQQACCSAGQDCSPGAAVTHPRGALRLPATNTLPLLPPSQFNFDKPRLTTHSLLTNTQQKRPLVSRNPPDNELPAAAEALVERTLQQRHLTS
jgi:hypothetical protein